MVIETDETLFLAPFNSLNIYIFLVILWLSVHACSNIVAIS
jgi:hypothetical protein